RGHAEKGYHPCWCERIYLGRVAQKSLECSPGNSALAWIAVEPEPVADRQQERDPQCRAASQRKKIEGKRNSLLRGLQLEDGLATRSAQDAAKRFGCCHHGAFLRVGEGTNLGSETATARPTVLDNFMGSPLLLASTANGFNPCRGGLPCLARGQGHRAFLRQTGFPDVSSSNVTATAAFAERRTFCPSRSATSPRSMKCTWPLCWPSPLSRFASLMRPLVTPATVPTWTPSAPITSMFWVILSVVIWSLLWFHRLRWS